MSSLLDETTGRVRPQAGTDVPPSPFFAACAAAVRAAVSGLVPMLVPVVLAWVLGAGGQATWSQAVRLSVGLWLLAQHTGLAVSGGHVGLVPLGLVVAPLAGCWFAARRLARSLDARADRIEAGTTRAEPAALSWRLLAVFCVTYSGLVGLASLAAGMPGLRPIGWQAVLGGAIVSTLGGTLGAAAYRYAGAKAGLLAVLARLPGRVRPWCRPVGAALAVWIGGAAGLVAALLATHASGVTALHRALDPGLGGGVVLTLGELALLPNLVVWAAATMAGPGIALGSGAGVTITTSTLGPLPAIPALAALPGPGPLPANTLALLAVPLFAGVAAGLLIMRLPADSIVARLGHVAGSAAGCGVIAGGLAWLAGGPAGPGRLADVGPSPLLTAAAFAGEVALGAVLVVLAHAMPSWVERARTRSAAWHESRSGRSD